MLIPTSHMCSTLYSTYVLQGVGICTAVICSRSPPFRIHVYRSIKCALCIQGINCFLFEPFTDVRNLSSVASLKTLHLIVLSRTTLSAVSAIFRNSTIKYLHLNIRCPVTVSEG